MHTNQNHKTTYRIITVLLLILWVVFIFSNSMDNADASTLKSGAVLALLRRILGSEGAALTEFIVRKTAHFTEFAIEGILLLSVVKGYTMRPLRFLGWPLLAGLMTALADETIQLFSLGRSSQVTDVWIDFAGVVTGTLLAFLVQAIFLRCKAGFFCRRFYVKMSGSKSVGIRLTGKWMQAKGLLKETLNRRCYRCTRYRQSKGLKT